jgi:hypothetical protein
MLVHRKEYEKTFTYRKLISHSFGGTQSTGATQSFGIVGVIPFLVHAVQ